MRKMLLLLLSLLMLASVTYNVAAAANLSTEQKFEALRKEGIFTGYSDGSSRLYNSMSREEFATVLYRLFELSDSNFTKSFDDVQRTRWSFQAIEAVNKAGLMKGVSAKKFSPEENVTVEQLAAVLVRATGYESTSNGFVLGTVSAWARSSVRIALDKGLIARVDDYTDNATRGQLVEAIYAVYSEMVKQPLRITKITPLTNRIVLLNLQQAVKNVDDSRFALRDSRGNYIKVAVSSISSDGLSIVLFSDPLRSGEQHRLIVDDNDIWTFTSISDDQVKPQVVSVDGLNSNSIEVVFSEAVDQKSATNTDNYRLNNGERVTKAQLTTDRKVTLTTTDQNDGWSYQLTIRGIQDQSGNTLDATTKTFINDNTKPKVTSVQVNATSTVTIKFNEKIDPQQAVQTNHYSINKGLGVTQATLQSDGLTVTLKTTPQQDATLYTLTVSGIYDLAGNVMDTSTNWKFGGVANPEIQVEFQSIKALNNNTVEIGFSRPITDADIANLKLDILKDNGNDVSMTDWKQFAQRKDSQTATVQYRTKSDNPKLFVPGHYYLARVSGVTSLITSDDRDELDFAGTGVDNPIPYVTQAIAIADNRVKIVFSEPVTNIDGPAFQIKQLDGKVVTIAYDELDNTNKIATEVVLRLDDPLTRNWQYIVSFKPNIITDAAEFNGLKTMEGNNPYEVKFTANW
ncbi:Ig-like domain-containing protein [Cohnella yongneupensis]|uniref:Ig-like domain-containing protein n=1 Tax=Cohnella yongneupensis TaxID=425006 RepID=A0ABW0R2G3_9BACL